jgi:ABC-2 type transport system permease protein
MQISKQNIAFYTLSLKEITRVLRIWTQSILPPGITMTLYFVIFGKLIGSHVPAINGISYMQYITPGLIMMPVITAAYINTATTFYLAKFQRSIEEILVSPMPNHMILFGYITGGVFRAVAVSGIVFIISLFFTHLPIQHIWLSIVTIILAAILFGLIGFTNGIFARNFDEISFVPNFILTPLTYLGGVFYSISLLPKFWYHVSQFNPIFHIINIFRYGMLGIADTNVHSAFLVIIFFIILFSCFNLYLLKRGIGIRN